MVDEYAAGNNSRHLFYFVQIPLWSMNTVIQQAIDNAKESSDSSMVDEYRKSPGAGSES